MGAALLPCKVVWRIGGDHACECWCLRLESLVADLGMRIQLQVIYKGNVSGEGTWGEQEGEGREVSKEVMSGQGPERAASFLTPRGLCSVGHLPELSLPEP